MSSTSVGQPSQPERARPIFQLRDLDRRIRSVWRRRQGLHLGQGLLSLFFWVTVLFLLGFAIDWWMKIPSMGRGLWLMGMLLASLYLAWRNGWRQLRLFHAARTALELERHYRHLNSLLVSAIQFRDSSLPVTTSASLQAMTCQKAEKEAVSVIPSEVVPFQPLRRPLGRVTVILVLTGFSAIWIGPVLAAGLSRIFTPWLAVSYPTFTQVEMVNGNRVVKQGAGIQIAARLSGVVPGSATLRIKTSERRPREIKLDIDDGSCEYALASTSRAFSYQIKAGDYRSRWYEIDVIPPPKIEQVKVGLQYPEYQDRPVEQSESLTMTIPEGTRLTWQVKLDRAVSDAFFVRDNEAPVPIEILESGRLVKFSAEVADSRGYGFSWVDKQHGFEFDSPRYFLQVSSDQAPQVELNSPAGNMVAMLGRPIDFALRARDDHGLDTAKIIYRVNRRDEQATEISEPVQNGQGEQAIDWDYREVLPDLKVGDSVLFSVEVADLYPAPEGPHQARSQSRRVTFLSREDYLKQIDEKKNRLLSQLRAVYRQQRSAHQLVRQLDPQTGSYAQSCQLEAIRQEMLKTEVNQIAVQLEMLIADLAANGVSDASEGETLEGISLRLHLIADDQISVAATQLREQVGLEDIGSRSPKFAASWINTAARELASLVLLRDIESAQEVFSRETRMFAEVQASLRFRVTQDSSDVEEIRREQIELSQWSKRLVSDLQTGMHYQQRPLAVLRLVRSVKDLRDAELESRTKQASAWIETGQIDETLDLQAALVRTFLDAEFSVRLSGAYSTLMKTRKELQAIVAEQRRISEPSLELSTKAPIDLRKIQLDLRKRLLGLLLPKVPVSRSRLFDTSMPEVPPIESLLNKADRGMAKALASLEARNETEAREAQQDVGQSLQELLTWVDLWAVETGLQTQGLGTLVAATSDRLARVEAFEERVIGLLDKTDLALADEMPVLDLAEAQEVLQQDVSDFLEELSNVNEGVHDEDLLPLMSRLEVTQISLRSAVEALENEAGETAIGHQETAADALAEALVLVTAQNERLGLLQDLLMFQRSIGFADQYMTDMVAEQRDLLAATEALEIDPANPTSADVEKLVPVFQHIQNCMEEVAPLLDLVASRLDVGTPLAFAKTDFEDAIASLQAGDQFDAIDAQDVAAESLSEVQQRVSEVQVQTGYVAEIVEFLHARTSQSSNLHYQQRGLRGRVESEVETSLKALELKQAELVTTAEDYAGPLLAATGMPEFKDVVDEMTLARQQLVSEEYDAAAESMELSELLLEENSEMLFTIIQMLHGLPSVEITEQTNAELIRLVEVLAVASDQKVLLRQTASAEQDTVNSWLDAQQDLTERFSNLSKTGDPHPQLQAAADSMLEALKGFEMGDRNMVKTNQQAADSALRHFIVEQALLLDTSKPISASSDSDPGADGEGSDGESEFAAGFISDFVSGEAPRDERSGWKVLGDRNRASLNQNFARELPLEYRGLLKNYYERVAK